MSQLKRSQRRHGGESGGQRSPHLTAAEAQRWVELLFTMEAVVLGGNLRRLKRVLLNEEYLLFGGAKIPCYWALPARRGLVYGQTATSGLFTALDAVAMVAAAATHASYFLALAPEGPRR